MPENEPAALPDAIELASAILRPFRESSLYDAYQEADGWTDEQCQTAVDVLTATKARDGLAVQRVIVVKSTEQDRGNDAE